MTPGSVVRHDATDAAIVPIMLTINDRTGITLWAPPWEDDDGEEWQGFLGDGAKILLYPSVAELAAFIASGEENDLSDHPGWGQVLKATPEQLRPDGSSQYDLDQVYEWAAGEPDPVHVSALADVVDMVGKIADCCDDGALRRLVEDTPEYAELVDEDVSYQGKDGRKRWNATRRHDRRLVGARDQAGRRLAVLAGRLQRQRVRGGRVDLGAGRRRADRDPHRQRAPTSPCAARSSPTSRATRPRSRSSAARTTSWSSPRSPTWPATAAPPRSTRW